MRGTTIELLWSHGIVCPLVRRSSRCTWGFSVAWKAGLHHKALFPHSTPERQSLFESHRQRRWLTHWSYLGETLPFGIEVLDFYHATEHLGAALGAAYGEGPPAYQERIETLRTVLRDDPQGVDKVIGALERLRTRYPRRQAIHKTLAYFREHRHRMPYAHLRGQHLPIGSGVVEAACKTLVSQCLKRSGMRWRHTGGQAMLTFRALCQSERFERAWPLLVRQYQRDVRLPQKVLALNKLW